MKKNGKKMCTLLLTVFCIVSSVIPVNAATQKEEASAVPTDKHVVFTNTLENPSQSYVGKNENGEQYTVGIEEIRKNNRAGTRTWRVYFVSGVINCEFYMDVSGNRCTSVYDQRVFTVGCSYSNVNLKNGGSYGKLSFDVSAYMNIVNFNGWLKGTCTGSNNDIDVTWNF